MVGNYVFLFYLFVGDYEEPNNGGGLSGGAIAGILIGVLVPLGVITASVVYALDRKDVIKVPRFWKKKPRGKC